MPLPLERAAREIPVPVNLEIDGGVGFVSVPCFVFVFLSFTCSAVVVDSVTHTLSRASAECSHGTDRATAQGAGCQDCPGAVSVTAQRGGGEPCHFL